MKTSSLSVIKNMELMIRRQQRDLETLLKDRKLLEDRVRFQNKRWSSYVNHLQDTVSQMRGDLEIHEKGRILDEAKSDLKLGLKEREAAHYKLISDRTQDDLNDLKKWSDALCQKFSNAKDRTQGKEIDKRSTSNTKEEDEQSMILERDLRSLKEEYEKLSLKKDAEVSALLLEKDFVWHQLKTMETNYNDKLKSKDIEIDKANEKIGSLITRTEQLQSSNIEKDETIEALRTEMAKMEADMSKRNDEISRISQELEVPRKSKRASGMSLLNRRKVKPKVSSCRDKRSESSRTLVHVKKEESTPNTCNHVKNSEKEGNSLKRKSDEVIIIPDTPSPKLFSSSFKIPKLKHSSPPVQ